MQICSDYVKKEINGFLVRLKPLPINPTDLLNSGLKGREIGNTMKKLTEIWIKNEFKNTKKELFEIIGFS